MAATNGKEYVGDMACPNAHCESHDMSKRVDVTLNDRGTLGTHCLICRQSAYAGITHTTTRRAWIAEMMRNGSFIGQRVLTEKIERKVFDPEKDPQLMQQVFEVEKKPDSKPAKTSGMGPLIF